MQWHHCQLGWRFGLAKVILYQQLVKFAVNYAHVIIETTNDISVSINYNNNDIEAFEYCYKKSCESYNTISIIILVEYIYFRIYLYNYLQSNILY